MQPQPQSTSPPSSNLLVFFLLAFLILVGFQQFRQYTSPPTPTKKGDDPAADPVKVAKDKQKFQLPDQPVATPDAKLIELGDESMTVRAVLDPRGAGVRKVTLNRFKAADRDARPTNDPLDLVPTDANSEDPSHLLYHFEPNATRPVDTLGKVVWATKGVENETVDGVTRKVVRFTATHGGLEYVKKYTLSPGDYHLGLEVTVTRPKGEKSKARLRYQLVGAKGLPIEGKWFASKFRNALIGLEDERGNVSRDFQEIQKIMLWGNGNEIRHTDKAFIRYAGVESQYFASVIVVANDQIEGQPKDFLAAARPTMESGVIHGKVPKGGVIQGVGDRISVTTHDGKTTETVYIAPKDAHLLEGLDDKSGAIAILYRNLGFDKELGQAPKLALEIRTGSEAEGTHALWEDDITVRVTTKPMDLEPGQSVTHKYLLYNGPVKPSLLGYLGGEAKVDPKLVDFYVNTLNLNTMTDYQSPGWFGHVWYNTGITWLVIKITNLIHFVLSHLYYWIPNLGLCVILLTVAVRGVMYPLSRKQAMVGLKMQALAPEMKKLAAKYGDDKQGLQLAQWDLFKKHGVNPLGSCWILVLQMPIFMGLWYALQESITFRLAPFWPTWVVNLAAPDMLWEWGRGIPILSRDSDYGGFLYLGPFFNILPIVAVVLMVIQQQMMTPPPTDEQQEMQQKMMKYMMIFFGLLFYKVAAGLTVYYIATTLWGFAERALLPKATLAPVNVDLDATAGPSASDKVTVNGPGGMTAKKKSKKRKEAKEPEPEATGFGKWRQGWTEWWKDVLEQAKKK